MSATDNSKDTESLAGLTAVDEILQILYWLRGEGLGTEVNARNLVRFLPMSEEAIEPLLSRMAEARLVVRVASSVDDLARYRPHRPGRIGGRTPVRGRVCRYRPTRSRRMRRPEL